MSATFKNAKKKLSQSVLRKFMNEHKSKQKEVKKIDSPLVKYNEHGQLTCILCKTLVRTEAIWTVHVNAKQHKQNIELAKKLKERTNSFSTPLKRPLAPTLPDIPEKKVKGILKNVNSTETVLVKSVTRNNSISEDFSHSEKKLQHDILNKPKENTGTEKGGKIDELPYNKDVLPEGFFDDPKLDAKARNQEYKDPKEEEWEKFIKAIKEADNKSNAIIADDQEEATTERQIDEIDEQMKNLSRVLNLEKKKVQVISISSESKHLGINEEEDPEDDDFVEFLDWRAKKS